MERKHRALLLALPTVLTLLFFFVAPMVYILVHTLHENGFSDFVDFFGDPFYRNILWVTLRVSLVSTAISLVLGYPTAFYMARTKSRMKQVMMIVILFPFGQRRGPFLRLDGHSGNQRPFEPAAPVLGAYLRPSENPEHGDGGHHRYDPPAGALHGPLPGGRAPEH